VFERNRASLFPPGAAIAASLVKVFRSTLSAPAGEVMSTEIAGIDVHKKMLQWCV